MPFWHIFKKFIKISVMNILILEDEQYLLEKLTGYLSDQFENTLACSCIHEATDALKHTDIQIAIVDHRLPDGLGIEFIKKLYTENQLITTMLMTAHSELSLAIESVNNGVDLFLEKPFSKSQFLENIATLISKAKERNEVQEILSQFTIMKGCQEILIEKYFLSAREIEIIQELFKSDKNELIAKKLNISPGTVKNHLANIYQKTHVAGKRELKDFIQSCNNDFGK